MRSTTKKAFSIASTFAVAGGIAMLPADAEAACPGTIPATVTYNNAVPSKNACTAADLKAFNDELAKDTSTPDSVEKAVKASSAGCAACIFTNQADTLWGPFVKNGQGGALANYGSCFQNAPGGSAACGKAYFSFQECLAEACSDKNCPGKAGTANSPDQCAKGAGGQACVQKYDFITACGGQTGVQALVTACGVQDPDFDKLIKIDCMMGTPQTDGGTDGGSSSGSSSGTSGSSSGTSGSSSSSSSGSSGASSSGASSSGVTSSTSGSATPDDSTSSDSGSGGCATTGPTNNGSLAAALAVFGASVIGITRRRRKKNEKNDRA